MCKLHHISPWRRTTRKTRPGHDPLSLRPRRSSNSLHPPSPSWRPPYLWRHELTKNSREWRTVHITRLRLQKHRPNRAATDQPPTLRLQPKMACSHHGPRHRPDKQTSTSHLLYPLHKLWTNNSNCTESETQRMCKFHLQSQKTHRPDLGPNQQLLPDGTGRKTPSHKWATYQYWYNHPTTCRSFHPRYPQMSQTPCARTQLANVTRTLQQVPTGDRTRTTHIQLHGFPQSKRQQRKKIVKNSTTRYQPTPPHLPLTTKSQKPQKPLKWTNTYNN